MAEDFAATQAYPTLPMAGDDEMAGTQAYPEAGDAAPAADEPMEAAAPAEGEASQAAPAKPKRGKPKDDMAPPKPKNAYQQICADARAKIKLERPELVTDLKGMALALKEAWDATPEETKNELNEKYEKEMAIWKPLWEEYKKTPHYKEFFEIKQDWIDARARKKLVKKMNVDAPKRPRSGYMIFAGEVRTKCQEEVKAVGGGMGDVGKKISEYWNALTDEEKDKYAGQSREQKATFDVEIVEYKKTEAWSSFCNAKAVLESKQTQKKLVRTKLDEAPKKAPSAYALYRSEVMSRVVEENKGKSCGELGKIIATMWREVPDEKKREYQGEAEKHKVTYYEDLNNFKKKAKYTEFLMQRQFTKAKENKMLRLREAPKRPMNAFSLYCLEHKNEVEPGKGEGKGRDALMKKYLQIPEEEKASYREREQEARIKWAEDNQAFKESQKYQEFKKTEKKIKMEFMNEATKVLTLRFLDQAPKQPPKSALAVFIAEKRKAMGEAAGGPKTKQARAEELLLMKKEWIEADLQTKHRCETEQKEQTRKWRQDCQEFMANDTWKEYVAECKRLKVPIQSILKEKKAVLRKLKNGMSIVPLPSRPDSYPQKPINALKAFMNDKIGEIKNKEDLPRAWAALDPEEQKRYRDEADEKMRNYRQELQDFHNSDEGKQYVRQIASISRRNKLAKAKDAYLSSMPKKPDTAFNKFKNKVSKNLKIKNPEVKGDAFKRLIMDKWENLEEEEKDKLLEDARKAQEDYETAMEDFKKSENWIKFKRAVKPKASGKGSGGGPPKPRRPEALPQKPMDAFKAYCKEMASSGKSLVELSKDFRELEEDEKEERFAAARERMAEYQRQSAEFDRTPEGRRYAAGVAAWQKRKRLAIAKDKFMKGEPKRPPSAFSLFVADKRSEVMRDNPDLKGLGAVQSKLSTMWADMDSDDKEDWEDKEKELKEEYDRKMTEFTSSPNYKKYQAILNRLSARPGAKAMPRGPAMPPAPSNLPKKPPTAFFLFLSEQKSNGNSANIAKATEGWRELGAEGQKKYLDEATERQQQFERDMKEFTRSAEGKRYLRLKAAAEKRTKMAQARTKFLGGSDAPKEPKRPPSAYFLFVQENRSKMPSGKISEVAKALTEKWNTLDPEEKQTFTEKADELKKEYEKDMAEYRNSASFKKYNKAIQNINKKPQAKAKAGKGKGKGRGNAAADSSSDSDVMGSDADNSSSSSDSDSD